MPEWWETRCPTAQVTIAATPTLISASEAAKRTVTVIQHGTTDVYIGGKDVTTGTGALLVGTKGASITIRTNGAVYGVVASGTQAVSHIEEYV